MRKPTIQPPLSTVKHPDYDKKTPRGEVDIFSDRRAITTYFSSFRENHRVASLGRLLHAKLGPLGLQLCDFFSQLFWKLEVQVAFSCYLLVFSSSYCSCSHFKPISIEYGTVHVYTTHYIHNKEEGGALPAVNITGRYIHPALASRRKDTQW